ncbi:four-carbon acid sugar kinase family protein [Tianweitania sp. BSSL-BM11]|uniref:Four-carbon acid sugar kinase family protein n=1 Tax=Tianweitania aestuarii TaxID=2814886 RepID=A0ABS5RRL5_9HYPH|nr:four-carbon acid sugar kinase family protein [Tianweitania aestuarii]MBS9719700.1 four-carbon acid sugar kinase family protein [Tianweitania aestuarii]
MLGIIADDFTGGLMIAGYIEGAGIACPVLFERDEIAALDRCEVAVIGTRTRLAPAASAVADVEAITERFERAGCTKIAYKVCASFDSTDDGNIGPVADFLSDRYNQKPLLLSAGFPRFGTTVHQGYLFYRNRLVSESIKRFDPLTPMSDPDMVRSLARQTRKQVGLLNHLALQGGVDAARLRLNAVAGEGHDYILIDCSDDTDAQTGAVLAASDRTTIGSDAHIIEFARVCAGGGSDTRMPAPSHAKGPAAVLVGSVGPVASAQLAAFEQHHPVLAIDILDERSEEAIIADALHWATQRIGNDPLAVTTAADQDAVEKAQRVHGSLQAARKAERILAAVARGLVERGVRRLAVAGGETSGSIVESLGIRQVRAFPDKGLGTGFCVAEIPLHLSLYLKPGKLGADDVLLRAVEAMRD